MLNIGFITVNTSLVKNLILVNVTILEKKAAAKWKGK